MKIRVYGPGCYACNELYRRVINVLAKLDIAVDHMKVSDVEGITDAGVLFTPALEINGKIVSAGRLLTRRQLEKLITGELSEEQS